jgi:hypothetical protein
MPEPAYKKLYQAPIPAVLAILIVFTWQGLGHFVMYMMDHYWFKNSIFLSSFIVGVVGVVMTWMGRNRSEGAATFLGFAGGSLIWLGWIEFSFVYVARDLNVAPIMWGAKNTLPEYRVMLSSAGVLFATLLFFFMNRDTRCNAFMWLHRNLGLKPGGEKTSAQNRNVASIVCMETIYVTWFCYIWLLVLYNPAFFGTDHWFTMASCGFFAIWTLYLAQRLWWFQRMAPALRYGIPTAIIGYNVVEILEKWGRMAEIWVHPQKYAVHIAIAIGVLVTVIVLAVLSPARRVVDRN